MHELHPWDRIRAYVEGSLLPEDAARMEAEIAADPALRLAVEEYRFAHRVTDPDALPAPACGVTFDQVWRRAQAEEAASGLRARRWWPLGLAAALIVLGLLLFASERAGSPGVRSPEGPPPVVLAAIPWSEPSEGGLPDLPPYLAGYRPVTGGRIRWLEDRGTARAVAAWTGRPVLVYVASPGCPLCREMDRDTLRDRGVLEVVARAVPLRLDVAGLPPEAQRDAFSRGWPFFALELPDGRETAVFSGWRDGAGFRERLAGALDAAGAPPDPLPAARVDAAGARAALRAARAAARDAAAPPGASEAARRELESLAARLEGPVADDLARVLARWSADGRFPELAEAKR